MSIFKTNKLNSVVFDYEKQDAKSQEELLRHITNLLADFNTRSLRIEVVVYGEAIGMLRQSSATMSDGIRELQGRGVVFHACRNSMKRHGIEERELLDGIESVPSGIGRIVKAQLEGYAYLKA